MVSIPRVVVAAPGSSHGKTSITMGLLAALRRRGVTVSGHKVGPDYIDPGYLTLAAGRVGRNLDPWLVGENRIEPLFVHGASTPGRADFAVVEGVMGLFDGVADRPGYASTAHAATLLRAPILLVVDASATGRSIAALVHGFATFDPAVRLGGVILNRVGSDRHLSILTEALAEVGVPLFGAVGRDDRLVTPSRHLGLVPAAERATSAVRAVADLGEVIARSVNLDAVVALARSAPELTAPAWAPPAVETAGPRPVVAVAGGPAFTFGYPETVELLTAAGADVVGFDPTADESLPAGTAGVVLGGGFPEMHAQALAANEPMRVEVAGFVARGGLVAAECAGLLYLARTLDGAPMCGAIAADAVMTPRLTLGYREAVAVADSILAVGGTRVRGHEFHRTACAPAAGSTPAWAWRDGRMARTEGFTTANLHASYLHLHWAGIPEAAGRLVAACRSRQAAAIGARDG